MLPSFIKKENQPDMNQSRSSTDLSLNLGPSLKGDIINSLVRYSSLLTCMRGKSIEADAKKLFDLNGELVKRLSILMTGDKIMERNEYEFVDENLFKDLNEHKDGLVFELNSNTRRDIVDLLTRNFSALFLSKCTASEKENLAKESNEMTCLLVNLVAKALKMADEDDDIDELYNRPSKRTKTDDADLLEKFDKLEKKVEEMEKDGKKTNEIAFQFEIKGIKDLLTSRKLVRSEYFTCLNVPWYLSLKSCKEINKINYLEFYLRSENDFAKQDKWQIHCKYDLMLFHPTNHSLTKRRLAIHSFKEKGGYGFFDFVKHDDLDDYIKDDTIKLGIKMKAKAIYEFINLTQ